MKKKELKRRIRDVINEYEEAMQDMQIWYNDSLARERAVLTPRKVIMRNGDRSCELPILEHRTHPTGGVIEVKYEAVPPPGCIRDAWTLLCWVRGEMLEDQPLDRAVEVNETIRRLEKLL